MQLPLENLVERLVESPGPVAKSSLDEEMRKRLALQNRRESEKRYKLKNREKILAANKTPTQRAKQAAHQRAYRARLSPEKLAEQRAAQRAWCKANPERRKAMNRRSLVKRRDKVLATQRAYRQRNSEKVREYFRNYLPAYRAKLRATSPQFVLADRMRSALKRGLRAQGLSKTETVEAMVGCTMLMLRSHIEHQFDGVLNWTNPELSIDHIVPICAFDLTDEEERKWAFNWQNLQPLNSVANKRKHATLPTPLPSWLPAHIAERILLRYENHKKEIN